jgi:hypothetical protein
MGTTINIAEQVPWNSFNSFSSENFAGYTQVQFFSGNAIVNAVPDWTVQVYVSTAFTAPIGEFVLIRTLQGSLLTVDVTHITFGASRTPTWGTTGFKTSDVITTAVDNAHDYYFCLTGDVSGQTGALRIGSAGVFSSTWAGNTNNGGSLCSISWANAIGGGSGNFGAAFPLGITGDPGVNPSYFIASWTSVSDVELPTKYLCGLTASDGNAADSGPGAGMTFSAIVSKADGSPNNCTVTGFLSDFGISENDIRAHLYDNATWELRVVNWSDLTMGDMKPLSGTVGDIEMKNGQFTMELRGLTQKLTTVIGSLYGPLCRAELFGGGTTLVNGLPIDSTNHWKCRLNQADWVQNGSVQASPDSITIVPYNEPSVSTLVMRGSATPTVSAPAGWFNDGIIVFTSGALSGYTFEIANWDGTTLSLFGGAPMPFSPQPGDTFQIEPGCDKTKQTCYAKFNNIINHAGEADIPGLNVIGAVSRAQITS